METAPSTLTMIVELNPVDIELKIRRWVSSVVSSEKLTVGAPT
jgi:hypothetical protein